MWPDPPTAGPGRRTGCVGCAGCCRCHARTPRPRGVLGNAQLARHGGTAGGPHPDIVVAQKPVAQKRSLTHAGPRSPQAPSLGAWGCGANHAESGTALIIEVVVTERECAVSGSGERPALLVATMSLVALTVAVLQTAVVPILGVMARQLDASIIDVSWVVTANLLAATSATPSSDGWPT